MGKYDTSHDTGSDKVKADPPNYVPRADWQPFPGFSYLFDNPASSLEPDRGAQKISVSDLDDDRLQLYKALDAATSRMDREGLARDFHFFALPASTYHITVWDGLNQGNLDGVAPEMLQQFREFFEDPFGNCTANNWPPVSQGLLADDLFEKIGYVRLKFKALFSRGDTVLVAELEAADDQSADYLTEIGKIRSSLDESFALYGKVENYPLKPHVAIGYFADSNRGRTAQNRHLTDWRGIFAEEAVGKVLQLPSISLYAFTDMVTYFQPSKS